MWSWSYGCLSRIRSEHCDMVAEFACPDDGKNDGHGEYLPRKGSPGVTVPGHTATPEACIAMGESVRVLCCCETIIMLLNSIVDWIQLLTLSFNGVHPQPAL